MKKAAVHNLGCKVNNYELDLMVQQLRQAGYEIVPFEEKADLYIINTCTVTNIADRKSRQMLHRAKHENPDAIVVAVGCYVETDRERLEQDPLVDLCIGNDRKGQIAEILQTYLAETGLKTNSARETANRSGNLQNLQGLQSQKSPDRNDGSAISDRARESAYSENTNEVQWTGSGPLRLSSSGRTRADIKIQDGCNQFCSYCVIPYARGRLNSRDPEDIVEEVKLLAAGGVKEVVLTGIHISSYGKEKGLKPEDALYDLLVRIQMIAGIERIRLGSLEPRIMTENFIRRISGLSKVCPHFHLSLQSGCDATLRRMNRHYTADEYRHSVELLRKYYDRPAITTDVIVGFVGETDEEFAESMEFCRQMNFYEIHVFKYSVRHGTAAAKMRGQCSPETKEKRSNLLLDLTHEQARHYRESFIGEPEKILLEEPVLIDRKQYLTGHTMRYVKGIVPAENHRSGEIVRGTFTGSTSSGDLLWMRIQT